MQLTEHFTLHELTRSNKAQALGLDNTPSADTMPRLKALAELLERVRAHINAPIIVTSGYRSRAVNKAVGGVTTSDHAHGMAADFLAPAYGSAYQIARSLVPMVNSLGIGQLIYEHIGGKSWVHISTRVPDKPANRVITISSAGTELGIQKV